MKKKTTAEPFAFVNASKNSKKVMLENTLKLTNN